jgi:histidinol-phosphate aminotransferase
MFTNLVNQKRNRILDNRNFHEGVFLNRAERVEPFKKEILDKVFNSENFSKLGNYFDVNMVYEKLSSYLNINQNELLITNGAEEAIRYIFNIILEKNDKIMFPIPTYGMYHVYTRMYQLESVTLDYDNNFKLNRKLLYENLSKVKVFFLPNPSHIEDLLVEEEIIKICNILKENNGFLVIDETYYGFGSNSMINLIDSIENIFIIRSLSKTFGLPSIRVGCLIGNEKIMNIISNYRSAYEISYPSLKIAEYYRVY